MGHLDRRLTICICAKWRRLPLEVRELPLDFIVDSANLSQFLLCILGKFLDAPSRQNAVSDIHVL